MIVACIDIGSNTTRLLVAEGRDGRLRELASRRDFTRIGKALARTGALPAEKIREAAEVAGAQAEVARGLGAAEIVMVATAAIREAPNRAELASAVEDAVESPLWILSGEEEARLSFAGATRTSAGEMRGVVAVVDVGGGSSEVAVGKADGTMQWSASFPVGSGLLADAHLRSDPPADAELEAVRLHVEGALADFSPPAADVAAAVGGTATSLRRLAGGELSHDSLGRAVQLLATTPVAEVATRFELDPERVRLLPAGIVVLEALSGRLGLPLAIARGGLREGVLLELLDRREPD